MHWLLAGLAVSVAALLIAALILARYVKRSQRGRSDENAGAIQGLTEKPRSEDGDKA